MKRHVFSPLVGRGWSSGAASIFVFTFSAFLHEDFETKKEQAPVRYWALWLFPLHFMFRGLGVLYIYGTVKPCEGM